ncbi:MAG: hypothetical protein WBX22_29050 [Silvibacterium sp.]
MKSHIQIEDDPRIWQQIAALIDEQFSRASSATQMQVSANAKAQLVAAGVPIHKQVPTLRHINNAADPGLESPPERIAAL